MKKVSLLLVLILLSNLGFSQNKQDRENPMNGIDIIVLKKPGSQPIINTENNPLIDQINELEEAYLENVTKNWFRNKEKLSTKDKGRNLGIRIYYASYLEDKMTEIHQKFRDDFYRIEGHQGKEYKKEDIFKAYINYLKKTKNISIPPPSILEERIVNKGNIEKPLKKIEKSKIENK